MATVKPITTLNTPIKPGPTGKQLIGSGGNPQRLSLWQEIQQNVELSKRARQSSNFKSYVKKEQVVLNGGKQVSGAKLTVETTTNSKIPTVHKPNSVIRRVNSNGNLISERIFDDVGKVITDIHYTDHGNPKMHPKVPHKHHWDWSDPNKPKPSK
ncbi:hypothetical protein JOE23_001374 [Amphibacillus cookii]|nr:hypothetical protein [Amphibacillus cookii]